MLREMHRPLRRHFRCSLRAVTRGAAVLAALSGVLVLASCSQTVRGEFSAIACDNGGDDDLDDLYDCADPDCWVFCPHGGSLIGPADSEFEDARMPDGSMSLPLSDSGLITNSPEDDAGMSKPTPAPEDDAGTPDACRCASDELCVDDECVPKVLGEFDLRGTAAYVPLYSATDRCYDYENVGCTTRRPIVCECVPPDPYVTIVLDGKALTAAITPPARRKASAVWSVGESPSQRVTLTPRSRLEFIVYDFDGLGSDPEIFRCLPDLTTLRTGTNGLSCSPAPGMTIAPPRSGGWSITVEFKKVLATAE